MSSSHAAHQAHGAYLLARMAHGHGLGATSMAGGGFWSSLKKGATSLASGFLQKAKNVVAANAGAVGAAALNHAKSALNAAINTEGSLAERVGAATGALKTFNRDELVSKLKTAVSGGRPVW